MEEQFLKISDVMDILKIKAPATILKAIRKNQLEAFKIGAQWRFPREQFNNMDSMDIDK
jgi:excisionase family DNA binding protein